MFACLATAAALVLSPTAAIAGLAAEVTTDARVLSEMVKADQIAGPAFRAGIDDFAADSMALSLALREAGLTTDLPCIFKGISEDSRIKADAALSASGFERRIAMDGLIALFDDAVLLAPMAGAEAEAAQPKQ
jgi:hypothetical protein